MPKRMATRVEVEMTVRIIGRDGEVLSRVHTGQAQTLGMFGRGNVEKYAPGALFKVIDSIKNRIGVAAIAAVEDEEE